MTAAPGATDAAIADAYDRRASEYIEAAGRLEQMDARDREAIREWKDSTSGLLVDAGCGPGHWTRFLAHGGRDVLGVDLSTEFISSARAEHPALAFAHGSFRELPLPTASVGGILAWYSLIHTPPAELTAVFDEFARVVAPGGGILIGFFDGAPREQFPHRVAPAYFWSSASLAELLDQAGFTLSHADHRPREAGEVSARPHAAVAAVRRA